MFLREKKELDYLLLLLRFEDRVTGPTKKFIETLANIFAPVEFFSHLSIVFTRSPIDPDDEELEQRKKYSLEIGQIIDEIFKLDENHKKVLEPSKTFFIDTKLRKKQFDEQSQRTVDVILDWIKFNLERIGPIKTEDLDYSEEKIKIRRDKELEEFKRKKEESERIIKELQRKKEEHQRMAYEENRKKIRLQNKIRIHQRRLKKKCLIF